MRRLFTSMIFALSLLTIGCKKQDDSIVVLNERYFIGSWSFDTEYPVVRSGESLPIVFEFADEGILMFNWIANGVRHTIGWEFSEQGNRLLFKQRDPMELQVIRFTKNDFTAYDQFSKRSFRFTRTR